MNELQPIIAQRNYKINSDPKDAKTGSTICYTPVNQDKQCATIKHSSNVQHFSQPDRPPNAMAKLVAKGSLEFKEDGIPGNLLTCPNEAMRVLLVIAETKHGTVNTHCSKNFFFVLLQRRIVNDYLFSCMLMITYRVSHLALYLYPSIMNSNLMK